MGCLFCDAYSSPVMFLDLMSTAHLSVSALSKAANSSGVDALGSAPDWVILVLAAGSATA